MKIIAGNSNVELADAISGHCFTNRVQANINKFAATWFLTNHPMIPSLLGDNSFITFILPGQSFH